MSRVNHLEGDILLGFMNQVTPLLFYLSFSWCFLFLKEKRENDKVKENSLMSKHSRRAKEGNFNMCTFESGSIMGRAFT